MLKTIRDAQEIFYLANNRYATDPAELDIEIPASKNFDYGVNSGMSVYATRKDVADSKKYLFAYRWNQTNAARIVCGYDNAAARDFAVRLCKTLGAKEKENDNRWILTK